MVLNSGWLGVRGEGRGGQDIIISGVVLKTSPCFSNNLPFHACHDKFSGSHPPPEAKDKKVGKRLHEKESVEDFIKVF